MMSFPVTMTTKQHLLIKIYTWLKTINYFTVFLVLLSSVILVMSTKDRLERKRSLKQRAAVARLVKFARVEDDVEDDNPVPVEDEDDVSQSLQVRHYNVFH